MFKKKFYKKLFFETEIYLISLIRKLYFISHSLNSFATTIKYAWSFECICFAFARIAGFIINEFNIELHRI